VLATVAAGSVEIEPRLGWREPLCVFVAVGMDAGSRKSGVFTALTRPLVEFEREQAEAALPAITEAAVLRRVAEQAAAHSEAAAGKTTDPAKAEELRAEAIARAAEAATLAVPPIPRWLIDDATPEALAGLLAAHGRIALLSPEGDVFDQMAGRYNQSGAGPNLGVYLKGHAGDMLKVDRRGRPPEYVERPCLTIGITVQPDVLRGLDNRPGFKGRGLLARFLYSLPASLVGRRQVGAPHVPTLIADRYAVEIRTLAASLTTPASLADGEPTVLRLDPEADQLLLAYETHLEPRLAPGSGDLAHLAGWSAKLLGATCRIAGLLHLAAHLRDGWARPVDAATLAGAVELAGYLTDHALTVFDLMGADARVDDARWLLEWIERTGRELFTRREAHMAASRGRFAKATDLDAPLGLLVEHGYLRRADPKPSRDPHGRGRPPSPRYLINPLRSPTKPRNPQNPAPDGFP
jgi:replicative DNA helicase